VLKASRSNVAIQCAQATRQVCWLATLLRLVFDTAAPRQIGQPIKALDNTEEFCLPSSPEERHFKAMPRFW
jgi:hypothetical protein